MQVGCIIQARLGSIRLPRKVLADIGGWPMIRHVCHRMNHVGIRVVIACPKEDKPEIHQAWIGNDIIAPDCDPNDVLHRYLLAAKAYGFDAVMRVTGDCPLIDPEVCSRVLKIFNSEHYDYVANDLFPSFPDGLGCEIFTRAALEEAHRWAKVSNQTDREHVTPWIKRGTNLMGGRRYCGLNLRCSIPGVEDLKFSVDTQEDLERARAVDALLPQGHLKYALESTLQARDAVQFGELARQSDVQ